MITLLSLLLFMGDLPTGHDVFMAKLTRLSATAKQGPALTTWLDDLTARGKLPFIDGEMVVFVYRESEDDQPVESVHWAGDFNRWKKVDADKGKQWGTSGVWTLQKRFPKDARLDYKLIINEGKWILDEANGQQQMGGFGPNSQLAMPLWKPSPWVTPLADVPKGLVKPHRVHSQLLRYDINYSVYTPAGYERYGDDVLHTIYVTDGQDYAHAEMGSMVTVLDNLIAKKKIPPVIAIFIDPRDPQSKDNRRKDEYWKKPAPYARFICEELRPLIDSAYRTIDDPYGRMIMGTSLGGIFTSYMAKAHADVFALIATHSPALEYAQSVMDLYQKGEATNTRHFVLTGTIGDMKEGARVFCGVLKEKGYAYKLLEVNEGHSWGNWRAHLDETLIYLLE